MSAEPRKGASSSRAGAGGHLAAVGAALSGAGGAFVATAATACCSGPLLAPLIVGVLGASGAAWAAGLKPYSPWLLAGSAGMLGLGFWSSYRAAPSCEVVPSKQGQRTATIVRGVLWISALLWIAAAAVNIFTVPGGGRG